MTKSETKLPTVGDRVKFGANERQVQGCVAFVGPTRFGNGDWVGVTLDEPTGRNDGSVQGVKYFECMDNHGMFIRPQMIIPATDDQCRTDCDLVFDHGNADTGSQNSAPSAERVHSGATQSTAPTRKPFICDRSEVMPYEEEIEGELPSSLLRVERGGQDSATPQGQVSAHSVQVVEENGLSPPQPAEAMLQVDSGTGSACIALQRVPTLVLPASIAAGTPEVSSKGEMRKVSGSDSDGDAGQQMSSAMSVADAKLAVSKSKSVRQRAQEFESPRSPRGDRSMATAASERLRPQCSLSQMPSETGEESSKAASAASDQQQMERRIKDLEDQLLDATRLDADQRICELSAVLNLVREHSSRAGQGTDLAQANSPIVEHLSARIMELAKHNGARSAPSSMTCQASQGTDLAQATRSAPSSLTCQASQGTDVAQANSTIIEHLRERIMELEARLDEAGSGSVQRELSQPASEVSLPVQMMVTEFEDLLDKSQRRVAELEEDRAFLRQAMEDVLEEREGTWWSRITSNFCSARRPTTSGSLLPRPVMDVDLGPAR